MKQLLTSVCVVSIIITINFLVITDGKTWQEDLTLTVGEKKTLDKFKELVADRLPHAFMKEDSYLIRWLRAKYFNIPDAEQALLNDVKWREDTNMDTISQEDWSDYDREYKYHLESRDKEGKPVLYVNARNWDLRKAALSGNQKRFGRYIDKGLEEACGLVRELGNKYKNVSQGILILNVDGFNLIQHGCLQCISTLLRVIVQYEAHHPGCADKLIIVNMPQAAEPILHAARAVLHPDTNKSLIIFGTNKKAWQESLREYFDEEQLPPELGGTKIYTGSDDDYNI